MTITGIDVLLVGPEFHDSLALTGRMRKWGFRCHFANSIRAAHEMVHTLRPNLVLCNVNLPDGSGYGLATGLSGLPVTMFLCMPVEESCYWLPAIDAGKECLGLPALRPSEFASALAELARSLPVEEQFTQ